jgi:hypothetical protein
MIHRLLLSCRVEISRRSRKTDLPQDNPPGGADCCVLTDSAVARPNVS